MKKVSIIIPVYNVEKYIDKCLKSLVNQTLEDIEIIVVNDGTLDNSQKVIDKYVKKYPNKVKSFIKKNGGQGSARNYGLKKASGQYIGFVDSDDFVEKDMFEILYNKAISDDYDIVICNNYIVSESGIKKEEVNYRNDLNEIDNIFFGKLAVWNKIYKRELILDNNIWFKEKVWYEDLAFSLKTFVNATKIGNVNNFSYNYLLREGSTMNNSNVERNLELLDAFDDIISYLKEHNKYSEYYDRLEYVAIDHIYISAVVRVLRCEALDSIKKEVILKLVRYFREYFSTYKNNKYLNCLSRNKRIVLKLLNLKQYWCVKMIFKLKGGLG